ncbi:hypothetical protein [Bacterioplanoides sp.]|uniref:hypothetical protein n=1 Tax=Bacterioplanoides sp. TaxID=2066072 RepID=UPI003B5C6FF0
MNRFTLAPIVVSVVLAGVAGCSDNKNNSGSSSSATVTVHSNQGDIAYGLIRSQVIGESGLPSTDFEQQPNVVAVAAAENGEASIAIPNDEVHQFQLVSRVADSSRDIKATLRKCQLVDGCNDTAFGNSYAPEDMLWRAVAYDLGNNENIYVTPFTELAAELAMQRVFVETYQETGGSRAGVWDTTGFYSPYSVVQSVSQVNQLMGVDDIQGCAPADLTRLDALSVPSNCSLALAVRHGALLAAWQKLNLDFKQANPSEEPLAVKVAKELATNNGQMLQSGTLAGYSVALDNLYETAKNNLEKASVNNADVKAAVNQTVLALDGNIKSLRENVGKPTEIKPASLSSLLGESVAKDMQLGIERSKKFLQNLRDNQADFFNGGEDFKKRLVAYRDKLKAVGEEHQGSFNKIIDAFVKTKQLYTECLQGNCTTHDGEAGWEWLTEASFSNNVLTINSGAVTVSQTVADINTTDSVTDPTSSQAIDLLIKGKYEIGGVTFVLDHTYKDSTAKTDIASPSGIRVYYANAVSAIQPGADELAYEIRWADFNFYANKGDADEVEVEGSYTQFYFGVKNPDNTNDERRYNIQSVALNGRISDKIDGDDNADDEVTKLVVTARSNNADEFYPEKKFVPFSGFLEERTNPLYKKGDSQAGLVSYSFGSETVSGQPAEYFDFVVPLADSYRYRFYQDRTITDSRDLDSDRDTKDTVTIHDFERCTLTVSGNTRTVKSCDPKQRILGARDIQKSLNDLWEVGVFSRIAVANRGTYFVSWPASQDSNQCLKLDTLNNSGAELSGTLYEQAVLGLNTMRFAAEVLLDDNTAATKDPNTLLDVSLTLTTKERYQVTAVLSHDYERDAAGNVSTAIGSGLDRISVVYNTTNELADSGSIAIFQDGVSLKVDGDTADPQPAEIVAAVQKANNSNVLPYKFITGNDGQYDRCVTANQAEFPNTSTLDDAIIPINYRGVVYGRIRKENNVWVVRFVNGEFQTLM